MPVNLLITAGLCAALALVLVLRRRSRPGGAGSGLRLPRPAVRVRRREVTERPAPTPRMRARLGVSTPDDGGAPVTADEHDSAAEVATPEVAAVAVPQLDVPAVPVPAPVMAGAMTVTVPPGPVDAPGWPTPGELAFGDAMDAFTPLPVMSASATATADIATTDGWADLSDWGAPAEPPPVGQGWQGPADWSDEAEPDPAPATDPPAWDLEVPDAGSPDMTAAHDPADAPASLEDLWSADDDAAAQEAWTTAAQDDTWTASDWDWQAQPAITGEAAQERPAAEVDDEHAGWAAPLEAGAPDIAHVAAEPSASVDPAVVTHAVAAAASHPGAPVVVVVAPPAPADQERALHETIARLEREIEALVARLDQRPATRSAAGRDVAARSRDTARLRLTDAETRELRAIAARRSRPEARRRAQIVLATARGSSAPAVGARLGVHRTTVRRWQERFATERMRIFAPADRIR